MGRDIHVLAAGADVSSPALIVGQLAEAAADLSISTAATATEARQILESGAVDCVVCDAELGSTSGVKLLAELRETNPTLPSILVLGPDAETTVEAALAAGVTDCVRVESSGIGSDQFLLVANRIRTAVAGVRAQQGLDTASQQLETSHHRSQELTASETKYRSLVEDVLNLSHIGTFILDAEFSVVWINDGIESYFGVDRDEIIGRDKRELIDGRIKHIFEDPDEFATRVTGTYDDNSYVEEFECHVLPTEGREERWLEHWSYPISAGPYEGGRIEHYLDITDRKHREEELADERRLLDRILETSPVGIALLDSDGQIVRANEHGERVLGLAESAIVDRSYDDSKWEIHDADGEPIPSEQLPFATVLQTGQPVFDFEHGITTDSGEKRWLSVSAAPLIGADGAVDRVVCGVRDMTAIKNSERELERQNRRLSEFASIVSHDLRNPLNVVGGSIDLAEETGEEIHFERARRGVSRMEQLIDDLLSLARSGEGIDTTETVDLTALATECWDNLPTEEATLLVETDQRVVADRSRLIQLFENLFRNSVEHGGSTVTITVGGLADGFFIDDDGPGIAAPDRDRVFDRGYSTRREGTGLGLAIVTQIASAHGWEVELADTDVGTRIELTGVELRAADSDQIPTAEHS